MRKKESKEIKAVTIMRRVRKFSWYAVDKGLIRKLLLALYEARGTKEEVERLSRLKDEKLVEQAVRSMGRPPKLEHFGHLAPVLLQHWLPKAKARDVKALAVMVQQGIGGAFREDLSTKLDAVAFLRRRNHTRNFLINLRKAFIAAHKIEKRVPSRPPVIKYPLDPIILTGEAAGPLYAPYDHQLEARKSLSTFERQSNERPASGILVLPTGAGKTDTAVDWLLDRLSADPAHRVLWLAHQQELLIQAAERFRVCATTRDERFRKVARIIFGGASPVSVLADPDIDVALVSIQSLSRNLRGVKQKSLRRFLSRSTYVVVDEVHHAGAESYRAVLEEVCQHDPKMLIGLTATPRPTSLVSRYHLKSRFPAIIYEVSAAKLIEQGILALPVIHTVQTRESLYLSAEELRRARSGDLPDTVLGRLDTDERNQQVVETWVRRIEHWGKTLLFATRIEHAETLTNMLNQADVPARALHSGTPDREATLAWFRKLKGPGVLVSVGMLTEGVDLPDAQTAFLARPTTSSVLLRQMIGRVLRGKKAGGSDIAHIVYFRDLWGNFADVLEPEEVIEVDDESGPDGRNGPQRLAPVIVDDEGSAVPKAVMAEAVRQWNNVAGDGSTTASADLSDRPEVLSTRLKGYYDLEEYVVSVFEHQLEGYQELMKAVLEHEDLRGRGLLSYFEEAPPPFPSSRSLRRFVDYVREFGAAPPFHDLDASLSPSRAADQVLAAGAITDERRAEIIKDAWESTIVRIAYPSYRRFEEAVEAELRARRHPRPHWQMKLHVQASSSDKVPTLPRAERNLSALARAALETARRLLPPSIARRLPETTPAVVWTRKVVQTYFGIWTIRLTGKNAGRQVIRLNRLLMSPSEVVPDEVLQYLIYHELLHSLLPGQGHDAEFRELEGLWPECEKWDAWLDTLHERFNTRAEAYREES